MDSLAAWGPTIVTVVCWIFFAGIMWQKIFNAEKRLDDHDEQHQTSRSQIAQQGIEIAKLNAWRDGYNSARTLYEQRAAHLAGSGGD